MCVNPLNVCHSDQWRVEDVAAPGAVLQMDNLYWKHPTFEIHTKRTRMIDMSQCNSGSTLEDVSSCGKRLIGGSKKKCFESVGSTVTGFPLM